MRFNHVASKTEQERRDLVEATVYDWEKCSRCGRCEKEYFVKYGWSMLLWHSDTETLCEYCFGDDAE